MASEKSGGPCHADGPTMRKRVGGPVMRRLVCNLRAGHDGPHRSGSVEWGDA